LKSLGKINFPTVGGQLLIRSLDLPNLYSTITTKDNLVVGKVNDIIGPKMDPHILVKMSETVKKNPKLIIGKELFEAPKQRKRGMRNGRKKSRVH
jgi:rRNA processing protein Gar1